MNKILTFSLVLIVVFSAATALAGDYETSTGHIARVVCKQKGSRLKVWGKIMKGSRCKKMDITIRMKNSENNDSAIIQDTITGLTKPGARFSGEDKVTPSNSKYDITSKYHWHVDNIYTTCRN